MQESNRRKLLFIVLRNLDGFMAEKKMIFLSGIDVLTSTNHR